MRLVVAVLVLVWPAVAADDNADVPALTGWRRELFGEKALALKHGKLALAIEKGRVATVERS